MISSVSSNAGATKLDSKPQNWFSESGELHKPGMKDKHMTWQEQSNVSAFVHKLKCKSF